MSETDYRSPMSDYEDVWNRLTSSEKALCLNYKKQQMNGVEVSLSFVAIINDIHEKYDDFHLGCIPSGPFYFEKNAKFAQDSSQDLSKVDKNRLSAANLTKPDVESANDAKDARSCMDEIPKVKSLTHGC